LIVASPFGKWDHVLDLQTGHDQVLGAEAVSTAISRGRANAALDFRRDADAIHGSLLALTEGRSEAAIYGDLDGLRFAYQPAAINLHERVETRALGIAQAPFAIKREEITELSLLRGIHLRIAQGEHLIVGQRLDRQFGDGPVNQLDQNVFEATMAASSNFSRVTSDSFWKL
jgi:hypothetical protein